MSETRPAVFFRNGYYLLPEGVDSIDAFWDRFPALPARVSLRELTENHHIPNWSVERGVCIAPYFYSDYGFEECELVIEDRAELYPVEVELFSQAEYNERLRSVILDYCLGCCRYKPLSNRPQSLNGHFEEIALNSVCFFRQEVKPSPRVFRSNLWRLGGWWQHYPPDEETPADVIDSIRSETYLKFDSAAFVETDPTVLHVAFQPDFFVNHLSRVVKHYIEAKLPFTELKLALPRDGIDPLTEFEHMFSSRDTDAFRKSCKKYGVALAELTCDPRHEAGVSSAIQSLLDDLYALELHREPGKRRLILLDECGFLKDLHFRSPVLAPAGTHIRICNQYEEKQYRVSFDMQRCDSAGKQAE